jgi:hypothetical protein
VLDRVFRMRSTSFRSVLAGSLVLALGLPGSALAAAPGSKSKSSKPAKSEGSETDKDPGDPSVPPPEHGGPPRVGRVFVDAGGLGDAGPVIGGRATLVGKGALQGQGVTHTDAPAGPELQVTLKERDAGGYRVDYVIVYDGTPTKNGSGGFDCQLCTEDELVEKVEALVIQVAPKMVVPEPESDGGPGPDPDVKDDGGGGTDPDGGHGNGGGTVTDEDPNALRGLGKAGIALVVVGGLGAITGVSLVAITPKHFPMGDAQADQIRTTRPPGWGALGGGVAALVVGAVLLAVDRKQAKRRAAGKAEARVHPWLAPQGAGLGVVGRF